MIFSKEQQALIKEYSGDMSYQAIADTLNKKFHTSFTLKQVTNHCLFKKIKPAIKKEYFKPTQEVIQFLKENIKDKPIKKLVQLVNEHFKINLSSEQVRNFVYKRNLSTGKHNGAWELPLGTERLDAWGYVLIKVPNKKYLMRKQSYLWQQANGEIPKGHNVIFLDGNKYNFELDNLALVSDSELGVLNSGLRFNDKELTKMGIVIAKHRVAILDAMTKGMDTRERNIKLRSLYKKQNLIFKINQGAI